MQASVSSFYASFPLQSSCHRIRVMVIGPGYRNAPIHAAIETIDLDDQKRAEYAALSYTWGNQPKSEHILIFGEKTAVTPNLFNALQHLRSRSSSLTIWVDAICINQSDNVERSSQVAMMDEVYRKCKIVHIWLGCSQRPLPSHYHPFALVEHFRDNKHWFELPGYQWEDDNTAWRCDTENPDYRSMMEAFVLVHDSAWWARAWTAQEAILPKVACFRYGDWVMSLKDFWMCQTNRMRHLGSPCCVVAYQAADSGPRATMDQVMGGIDCVTAFQEENSLFKTLLDVLRRFGDRQCSDPRDKIYSLLGFLSPQMPRLVPDYTRPVGEIYVEAFCAMIKERKGSLCTILGEGFNSCNLELPSWVPDFSKSYKPKTMVTRALRAYPLFTACGSRSGQLEIFDEKTLHATGTCIDRVEAKSKLVGCTDLGANTGEIYEDWRQTCRQQGINISTTVRDEAFCLLLVGEMTEDPLTFNYRRLKEDDPDLPTDSQWQRFMGPEADGSTLSRPYRVTVGSMVEGKSFFVTSGGRIGLSWPVVEVGDEVWILNGGNVPFLLRKPKNNIHNPDRILVGDVYIYGLMHGEGVRGSQSSQAVFLI